MTACRALKTARGPPAGREFPVVGAQDALGDGEDHACVGKNGGRDGDLRAAGVDGPYDAHDVGGDAGHG